MALNCYHEFWAVAKGRVADYRSAWVSVHDEENCGVHFFDGHYRLNLSVDHAPSEAEVTAYVIRQFQRIDERLGIVLPEDHLEKLKAGALTVGACEKRPNLRVPPSPEPASGETDENS